MQTCSVLKQIKGGADKERIARKILFLLMFLLNIYFWVCGYVFIIYCIFWLMVWVVFNNGFIDRLKAVKMYRIVLYFRFFGCTLYYNFLIKIYPVKFFYFSAQINMVYCLMTKGSVQFKQNRCIIIWGPAIYWLHSLISVNLHMLMLTKYHIKKTFCSILSMYSSFFKSG